MKNGFYWVCSIFLANLLFSYEIPATHNVINLSYQDFK